VTGLGRYHFIFIGLFGNDFCFDLSGLVMIWKRCVCDEVADLFLEMTTENHLGSWC